MPSSLERLVGGPISWGVCEVPGWGAELPPDRVLSEMASIGLRATEAGPDGYLGTSASEISALLERHGLELIGGFLPVVLHDRSQHEASIAAAHRVGELFEAAGAKFLVSAVVVDLEWSPRIPLSDEHWHAIFDGFTQLDEVAAAHGLTQVAHPHWGTLVQEREDVERLLDGSDVRLCLDTGHLVLGETDPAWFAETGGGRIAHVHLKDVAAPIAEQLRNGDLAIVQAVQAGLFRPLGAGSAPVAETVRALEAAGYRGKYVLEQDCALPSADIPPGEGPIDDVRRSIEFLRRLLDDAYVATPTSAGETRGKESRT
ncbi:MAG TPA: TIM barrel protein [Gaiellaceae bacterium]|nr:TIM barrel protein [Gaiellaceae bacterium]